MSKTTIGKLTFYNDIVQGSQEWLDIRKGRVTCSNALTLLEKGVNACLEANRLSAERLTPNGNGYAERGHVIEDEMRNEFNEHLKSSGLKLVTCGFITNSDYPNAGYSPDGLIMDSEGNLKGIAEFKAYNDVVVRNGKEVYVGKHEKACQSIDNVPLMAKVQCQMEMMIMEANVCYLFLCNPDAKPGVPKTHVWELRRDPAIVSRIKTKLMSK